MSPANRTRNHNIHVLTDHGFDKFRNTTVFQNGNISLISPAVAQNTNGTYWFDLRKVNLDRLSPNAYILVRIVPDVFIFQPISSIQILITQGLMRKRPHSGNVWGMKIALNPNGVEADLFNVHDSQTRLKVRLLSLKEICVQLGNLE